MALELFKELYGKTVQHTCRGCCLSFPHLHLFNLIIQISSVFYVMNKRIIFRGHFVTTLHLNDFEVCKSKFSVFLSENTLNSSKNNKNHIFF